MSARRLPALVVHADWSKDANKRWMAIGSLIGSSYRLRAPRPVGDVTSLLRRLAEHANERCVVVGFDFPIGLPRAFAKCSDVSRFMDILPLLGTTGKWAGFYEVATSPTEVSFSRPFYPYRPGGTSQTHLTKALRVPGIRELMRACELRTSDRGDACALFWTLGPKQVGKAAIIGWRDMLSPALSDASLDVAVWPFDGALDRLLRDRQCIVVETYPAEACLHLGMTPPGLYWSKRSQNHRKEKGCYFLNWAGSRGVVLEEELEDHIRNGFGPDRVGEDAFDAVLGLMSMIEVLLGHRPDGLPECRSICDIEGWIFGQIQRRSG